MARWIRKCEDYPHAVRARFSARFSGIALAERIAVTKVLKRCSKIPRMRTKRVVVNVHVTWKEDGKKKCGRRKKKWRMTKGWAIMVERNFSRGEKALSLRLETFYQRSENRERRTRARVWIRSWRKSLENVYQMYIVRLYNK